MQLIIELPPREEQIAFNRRRWEVVCADPELSPWRGRVETNAHGNILLVPPASGGHSAQQGEIVFLLRVRLGGYALPECPVSTIDGVRAADVGWYSEARFARVKGQIVFEIAPEICVEVLSPANTGSEMREKKKLYFEAGAQEVWFCAENGALTFFLRNEPEAPQATSSLCTDFPVSI